MPHPLAEAQEIMIGCPGFTRAERQRIIDFKIPGDYEDRQGGFFFPRRPTVNVERWRREHAAKLHALEQAARDTW